MLGALPGAVDSVSTDLRGGGWEVMGGPGPPPVQAAVGERGHKDSLWSPQLSATTRQEDLENPVDCLSPGRGTARLHPEVFPGTS